MRILHLELEKKILSLHSFTYTFLDVHLVELTFLPPSPLDTTISKPDIYRLIKLYLEISLVHREMMSSSSCGDSLTFS